MKLTEDDFANAVEKFGIDVAEEARDAAVAAHNCNALAGHGGDACDAEEYAAWIEFLDASPLFRQNERTIRP